MRYLITGAAGFIGSNILRHLAQQRKHEIHILTRPSTDAWRINDILPQIYDHKLDLLDSKGLNDLIKVMQPEIIIHLAAHGAYLDFQTNYDEIARTNYLGTVHLLQATQNVPFRCFFNAASSSEYGSKKTPMKETDLLEPLNIYGATKAATTILCQTYARLSKKNIISGRLFSVYGYYEEPFRLIPDTILHALEGKNLCLTTGDQKRDFVFIEDIITAIDAITNGKPLAGAVLNLGTGFQYSVREVAATIVSLMGSNIRLKFGAKIRRDIEYSSWVADTTTTEQIIGWKASHSLRQGLEKAIAWFRAKHDLYKSNNPLQTPLLGK